jgi:hypothetical protein
VLAVILFLCAQNFAQNKRQNPTVLVIVHLDGSIDPQNEGNNLPLSVLPLDFQIHGLARLKVLVNTQNAAVPDFRVGRAGWRSPKTGLPGVGRFWINSASFFDKPSSGWFAFVSVDGI